MCSLLGSRHNSNCSIFRSIVRPPVDGHLSVNERVNE